MIDARVDCATAKAFSWPDSTCGARVAEGLRRGAVDARIDHAERSDARRGRNDRLRCWNLDRAPCPARNAPRDHREAVGRCERGVENSGCGDGPEAARYRSAWRHAEGICRLHPRRHRKVGRYTCAAGPGEMKPGRIWYALGK